MDISKMSNSNMKELQTSEMKRNNGGFMIFAAYYAAYKLGAAAVESLEGAYEAGHDAGKNSCEC